MVQNGLVVEVATVGNEGTPRRPLLFGGEADRAVLGSGAQAERSPHGNDHW